MDQDSDPLNFNNEPIQDIDGSHHTPVPHTMLVLAIVLVAHIVLLNSCLVVLTPTLCLPLCVTVILGAAELVSLNHHITSIGLALLGFQPMGLVCR